MNQILDATITCPEFLGSEVAGAAFDELSAAAFSDLALSHYESLWRAAKRLTRDREAAEDLVQETYVRALRARESFRLREFGMRPWLLRILRNLYLNHRATQARRPAPMAGEQLDCLPSEDRPWASQSVSTEHAANAVPTATALDAMDQELAAAIVDLPPTHQAALMLWAVEGLTYNEVAAAVNAPPGTVMSRLHRARGRLSERLADFAIERRLTGDRSHYAA